MDVMARVAVWLPLRRLVVVANNGKEKKGN
jgi:hypothetical protein